MFWRKKNNKKNDAENSASLKSVEDTLNKLKDLDINDSNKSSDISIIDLESMTTSNESEASPLGSYKDVMNVCNIVGDVPILYDNTDYTLGIPYPTLTLISEIVQKLPVKNFKISASRVLFKLSNSKKDHIIYNNKNGIFEAEYKYTTTQPDGKQELAAKVIIHIPVNPFRQNVIEKMHEGKSGWYVLTLSTDITVKYDCTEPIKISDMKDICLVAAKSVIIRSSESDAASKIMVDKNIPNIFPQTICDLDTVSTSQTSVSVCKYSTTNTTIDDIYDKQSCEKL